MHLYGEKNAVYTFTYIMYTYLLMVVQKVQATKSKLCNFGADFVMALTDISKVLLHALYHVVLEIFTTN